MTEKNTREPYEVDLQALIPRYKIPGHFYRDGVFTAVTAVAKDLIQILNSSVEVGNELDEAEAERLMFAAHARAAKREVPADLFVARQVAITQFFFTELTRLVESLNTTCREAGEEIDAVLTAAVPDLDSKWWRLRSNLEIGVFIVEPNDPDASTEEEPNDA